MDSFHPPLPVVPLGSARMGESSMGMKSSDLVTESSPSSSRSHSADVVWPPHAYADVGISFHQLYEAVCVKEGIRGLSSEKQVDYSGAAVSLHQQHPYERVGEYVGDGRESPLVVYQEVPSPFSQQGTSAAAVDAYVQVPFGALSRVAVFRESPIPSTSDAQQQQYEQELEASQADEIAAMSQVLDLHRSSTSSRLPSSSLLAPSRVSVSSPPSPSRSPSVLVVPGSMSGSSEEVVSSLRPVSLESQLAMSPAAAALGLPVLLEKSALVAASTSSRSGGLAMAQKFLLEQAQYLAADLSSRDLLPPILQGPSSSAGPSTSSQGLGFSHKSILAHKFPHLLVSGSVGPSSGHGAEGVEEGEPSHPPQLMDYASSSTASILDVHGPPLYAPHHQVSLPIDVFVTERGEVALVSSSAEDGNDLLDDVQQYHAATEHVARQNGALQSYVSSSADMVGGGEASDPGMHSTVDSTGGSGLHSPEEHMIDTSDGYVGTSADSHHMQVDPQVGNYSQQLELSSTEEASTSHGRAGVHSVLRMQRVLQMREPLPLEPSSSASPSAVTPARVEVCSDTMVAEEESQNCQAVSSVSQPDSTRSPELSVCPTPPAAPSPQDCSSAITPSLPTMPQPPTNVPLAGNENVGKADTGHFWCEDCGQFYDKECSLHRVQLIVDKPVLTRAWASLPASYLYVHKVAEDEHGEPVYGVFAKKSIPKRTQFGPIEGVLQRMAERPQESFPLLVSEEGSNVMVLDTSDETQSNWMRFVRPAQCYAEQNVILVQQECGLYFNTTRALTARSELRVWYSTAYAHRWGLPLLRSMEELQLQGQQPQQLQQPQRVQVQQAQQTMQEQQQQLRMQLRQPQQSIQVEQQPYQQQQLQAEPQQLQQQQQQLREEAQPATEQHSSWPCFKCSGTFSTSEELQRHLNLHEKPAQEQNGQLCSEGNSDTDGRFPRKCRLLRVLEESKDTGATSPEKTSKDGSVAGADNTAVTEGGSKEEYGCDLCQKVFSRKYGLTRHLIMHSGEKKYKCTICDLRFTHPYNRKRHVMRHQHSEDRSKLQRVRSKLVRNASGVSRFENGGTVPTTNEASTSWGCPQCRLVFHSAQLLDLHLPLHAVASEEDATVEPGRKQETCPECDQEFCTRGELIRHISIHGKRGPPRGDKRAVPATPSVGDTGMETESGNRAATANSNGTPGRARRFKCSLCYKSFATDERLAKHYQVHGNDESKPLQCEYCQKRFLNNSALTGHLKTHSRGERFFECPICKEKFHVITALKEHVYTHCVNGVYTCPTCGKTFFEYNQARKHIRAFHTDQRFPCGQCDKVFPRQDKLKLHMLCHSEHREFLCASCGKQFKRKDKLKEHMQRLHGPDRESREAARAKAARASANSKRFVPKVSPTDYQRFIYKCHACLLGFRRRGMLVNHLARRHPDVPLDTVPELNLPILKATRDYYCQYCEKVYRSSSKRKAHILKNHPGAALPMSNRTKGGVPTVPGEPNPTFSHMVGSVTTHPHNCNLCHKQYASKAKLLQHQRKKHMDLISLTLAANPQLSKASRSTSLSTTASSNVIATGRVTSAVSNAGNNANSRGREADLLTQAMSELTQTLTELRQTSGNSPGAFIITPRAPGLLASALQGQPATAAPQGDLQRDDTPAGGDLDMTVHNDSETAAVASLDQAQINQLLAQYQQQAALSSNGGNDSTTSQPPVTEAALVIPAANSNWTIVSVTSAADDTFEQEFSSS
ncbi:uncharacterized protein LOC135385267 isoform X2 [Ornithodoros turicata]|uniref:uncharacterized protein LOC135385267 isoform X2 n=1 Tax=Ornithodoros turicata TaxID=34597 RepID=UPI0031393EAA